MRSAVHAANDQGEKGGRQHETVSCSRRCPTCNRASDSIRSLFGAKPSVLKDDYAKWMLDDPRINFAISERTEQVGVNHLGLQVESADELEAMRDQLGRADASLLEETGANCCYAKSDKYWVTDPQGVAWETFHSLGAIPVYGDGIGNAQTEARACCAPEPAPSDKDQFVVRALLTCACCSCASRTRIGVRWLKRSREHLVETMSKSCRRVLVRPA